MKGLFLLIALYTISGKQVEPSGDIPAGAACVYEQTGSKSGQMTAGNSIDLTLTGYDGATLQSVTLMMKSNTSSGAGRLTMSVGERQVWEIANASFATKEWNGGYSAEFVPIEKTFGNVDVASGEAVSLHIEASVNSLYLQSVALEYTAPVGSTYTVSFDTHVQERVAPITESQPGAGIILPDMSFNDPGWSFLGWVEKALVETADKPYFLTPGTRYVPAEDCTLHAVYQSYVEQQLWLPADSLVSGDYLITLCVPTAYTLYQASGSVENGMLPAKQYHYYGEIEDPIPFQMDFEEHDVYTLNMQTDSTLTILHKATGTKVSLSSGGKFTTSSIGDPTWSVTSRADENGMTYFAFSGVNNYKKYSISVYFSLEGDCYFRPVQDAAFSELLLYALDDIDEDEPVYTSYPLGDALHDVTIHPDVSYETKIGLYKLIIRNGQKFLQINE